MDEYTIDLTDLIQAVRDIAAGDPDHKYEPLTECGHPRCMYWDRALGEPSCLIGRAAFRCGVSGDVLKMWDERSCTLILDILAENPHGTNKQKEWLGRIQATQDAGMCWSSCVEVADRCDE